MDAFHSVISHDPIKPRSEEIGRAPVTKAATEGTGGWTAQKLSVQLESLSRTLTSVTDACPHVSINTKPCPENWQLKTVVSDADMGEAVVGTTSQGILVLLQTLF